MNAIAKIRTYQTSRARLLLAALVIGWINVILQPCVMAAPQHGQDMFAVHSGLALYEYTADTEMGNTCPHCGDDVCVGTSGCEPDVAVNSKSAPSPADSGVSIIAVTRTAWIDDRIQSRDARFQFVPTPEALPRPVPLTVVYCVFLK